MDSAELSAGIAAIVSDDAAQLARIVGDNADVVDERSSIGGWRLLGFAVEHDRPRMVSLLLDEGAQIDLSDPAWNELCASIDVQLDAQAQAGDALDSTVLRILLGSVGSLQALEAALAVAVSGRWHIAIRLVSERIVSFAEDGLDFA